VASVEHAFEEMVQSLDLTEGERTSADEHKGSVLEALKERLGPREVFISGSFGRNTCIRPLHDIDLFVVLNEDPECADKPRAWLRRVQDALEDAYDAETRPQRRSINIVFDSGLGFDVLPALQTPGGYRIPDVDEDRWIPTNPRAHRERCDQANERAGQKLKPLVKVLKHWHRDNAPAAPSFLLEAVSWEAFSSPPRSYPEGLAHLFAFCGDRLALSVPNPMAIGPDLDAELGDTNRTQLRDRLRGAARDARRALAEAREGNVSEAHRIWRELLGSIYRGR